MCGIVGVVNRDGHKVDGDLLQAMTDMLHHRGPDGAGYYRFAGVGFGHRRLSIIDVDAGRQPMSNEDGTVWVTFNGEIYNFQVLRSELRSAGHTFRTHSDTEVLVHGYEQWGEEVVSRLRGMFAFSILDQRRHRLLLARDRFGIKPLVYYESQDKIVFASEIKAILRDPGIPRVINEEAVADYFELGYIPAPHTVFRGIHKLLPGHLAVVDLNNRSLIIQRPYWRLQYGEEIQLGEAEAMERLDVLLANAVRSELVSDVPLGAFLSGGIDSSTVVSMMARNSSSRVKSFTIGFREERFSEVGFAREVAEAINTEHHEYIVEANVAELLPRLAYHFDEPFADASAVPTYYLCQMARQNVTVCLSGDGADELFAGYDRYRHCLALGRMDFIPHHIRRAIFGPLGAVLGRWRGYGLTPEERFIDYMRGQYGVSQDQVIFSLQPKAQLQQERKPFDYLRNAFCSETKDVLHRYLEVDASTYLPNDILAKVDVTSMMNSLEVRVPFLDHELAEFVARLPSGMKLRNGISKYLLKKTMGTRLPKSVLNRPKMGFGVPVRQWVTTSLRDMTHEYLLNQTRVSGLLDVPFLRRMVEDNEKKLYRSQLSGKLWWALFFEVWYQDVYDSNSHKPKVDYPPIPWMPG